MSRSHEGHLKVKLAENSYNVHFLSISTLLVWCYNKILDRHNENCILDCYNGAVARYNGLLDRYSEILYRYNGIRGRYNRIDSYYYISYLMVVKGFSLVIVQLLSVSHGKAPNIK